MEIVVFYSPHCACCSGSDRARHPGLIWRDVTRHLDEAVALGVLRPPAVVISGRLRWQGAEAVRRLRNGSLR